MVTSDKSIIFTYGTADSPRKAGTNITNRWPLGCEPLSTPAQPPIKTHFMLKSESLVQNHNPPNQSFFFFSFNEKMATMLKYFLKESSQSSQLSQDPQKPYNAQTVL